MQGRKGFNPRKRFSNFNEKVTVKPTYLFEDTDPLSFLINRDKIIARFQIKEAERFIDGEIPPHDEVLAEGYEAEEYTFEEERPDWEELVNIKVTEEENLRRHEIQEEIEALPNRYPLRDLNEFAHGNTPAVAAKAKLDDDASRLRMRAADEAKLRGELARIPAEIRKYYEKRTTDYLALDRDWVTNSELTKRLSAKCAECFEETFGPAILQQYRQLLINKKFRTVWQLINCTYGLDRHKTNARATATALMNSLEHRPNDNLTWTLEKFEQYKEMYRTVDLPIDDTSMVYALQCVMDRGNCTHFNDIFNHQSNNEAYDFRKCIDLITKKYVAMEATKGNGYLDKYNGNRNHYKRGQANPINTSYVNATDVGVINSAVIQSNKRSLCSKCGKSNHSASECWSDITCSKCGKLGHPTDKCRQGTVNAMVPKPAKESSAMVENFKRRNKVPKKK